MNPEESILDDRKPCHHCGRRVMRSPALGTPKYKVRHMCPHGIWCSAGDPKVCMNNRSHSCPECQRIMREAEMAGKKPWR